jgi:argininosuccinate lyase
MQEKKLWGGRFRDKTSSLMERIGESISYDKRLYKEDIQASIAHAKNLEKIGILSKSEFQSIEEGLNKIKSEIESGSFEFSYELEDIHMNIEKRLTDLIGEAGKKLHTARSRNDQVGQDVRLFIRNETRLLILDLIQLLRIIIFRAKSSIEIIMPGYTHLQVAQPIRASHYFLSYFWGFLRDMENFQIALQNNEELVLGSGAMAGVNYSTDRGLIAKELSLSRISKNSMDAVASRDHILSFLFASSQFMARASRFCEEITIFTSVEFSFFSLPDNLTTGSSIMPQKKNPDIAELIRGKTGKVYSNLNHLLVMLKGLPLTYNRDLQEDKLALFDSLDNVRITIEGISEMFQGVKLQEKNMQESLKKGFATATDLADFLVSKKSTPFREAHELVGRLVRICVEEEKTLFTLSEESRLSVSPCFSGEEYFDAISLDKSADKKNVFGGTARERQEEQILLAENSLVEWEKKYVK